MISNLQVLDVTGPLPKDGVQTALNDLTKKLNDNYPLGIHADSVEVTGTGVVGNFSSQNASIPREDANPCFYKVKARKLFALRRFEAENQATD